MSFITRAVLAFVLVLLLSTQIASQDAQTSAPAADEITEDDEAVLRSNARETKAQARKREIEALLKSTRRENDVLAKARNHMRRTVKMVHEAAGKYRTLCPLLIVATFLREN